MKKILRDSNGYLPPIDVICQHTTTGNIIPLRVRIKDEDGESNIYPVKQYKGLPSLDGLPLGRDLEVFECVIPVRNMQRRIIIYFNRQDGIWRLYGASE